MYLHIVSFDGKKLSLTTGDGPLLIGHYMYAAEWRVGSSLLASIASAIPDMLVAVVGDAADVRPGDAMSAVSGTIWSALSLDDLRDSESRGFIPTGRPERIIFLPNDRGDTEDCVYRTFSANECFIAPHSCRRSVNSLVEFEPLVRETRIVEVVLSYHDIDVIIHDDQYRQVVLNRVSRVVADFNQM